jgi:membrane-associated protease RseP (regulator of RpoE activity)
MSAPRHLWSGDWQEDSAAHADAIAQRNAQRGLDPDEPEPDTQRRIEGPTVASRPAPLAPTLGARIGVFLAALGRGLVALLRWIGLAVLALFRGLRTVVRGTWRALRRSARVRLAAALVLLIAVVAVGAVAIFSGGSSNANAASGSPAAVVSIDRWLGVQLIAVPGRGVVMEYVNQNGAAGAAGFEPGDTLTQVNNTTINGYGDVAHAFGGVKAGDQIMITVQRGSSVVGIPVEMPPRP